MKALTIHPHWAWAIMHGGKDVENRSRRTNHRGLLAIHSSLKISSREDRSNVLAIAPRLILPDELPRGVILGTVELVDCVHADDWDFREESRWAEPGNWWHWILRNPRKFRETWPARGSQGIWEIWGRNS